MRARLAVHSFPPDGVQKYGLEIPEGFEPPEGLAVFGASDEMVWATLPRHDAPVFAIREHDVEDVVLAATNLAAFLRVETANALLLLSGWGPAHDRALDALGTPAAVREQMADDYVFERIIAWADPDATDRRIYYDREPLSAAALRGFSAPR